MLEEQLADHEEQISLAREIHSAADRGASLTRQLLAFSRKQILRPVTINLNSAVNDIQAMLRRLIGEDVKLEIRCEPDLFYIEADQGQFDQVLMNLAVNARDDAQRRSIDGQHVECRGGFVAASVSAVAETRCVRDVERSRYGYRNG